MLFGLNPYHWLCGSAFNWLTASSIFAYNSALIDSLWPEPPPCFICAIHIPTLSFCHITISVWGSCKLCAWVFVPGVAFAHLAHRPAFCKDLFGSEEFVFLHPSKCSKDRTRHPLLSEVIALVCWAFTCITQVADNQRGWCDCSSASPQVVKPEQCTDVWISDPSQRLVDPSFYCDSLIYYIYLTGPVFARECPFVSACIDSFGVVWTEGIRSQGRDLEREIQCWFGRSCACTLPCRCRRKLAVSSGRSWSELGGLARNQPLVRRHWSSKRGASENATGLYPRSCIVCRLKKSQNLSSVNWVRNPSPSGWRAFCFWVPPCRHDSPEWICRRNWKRLKRDLFANIKYITGNSHR